MKKLLIFYFAFSIFSLTSVYSQIIINESFNDSIQAPEGWVFQIGKSDYYTTKISSGEQIPSIRFSINGQFIETCLFSNATGFSFWTKGNSTDSASTLIFEFQTNEIWYKLDSVSNIKSGKTFEFNLPDSARKIRFIYRKSAGNIAFDDLKVFKNIITPDSIAPEYMKDSPTVSNITSTSCNVAISLDKAGTLYYMVLPENSSAPTFKDIKESTLPNSGHIDMLPDSTLNISIQLLVPNSKYIAYFIKIGNEPNYLSDSIIKAIPLQTKAAQNNLFFSKIYRGAGNNKVIEIYNPSSDTIYLNKYRIALATNGAGWKTTYFSFPEGSAVLPKNVFVIAKTTADSAVIDFSQVDCTTGSTLVLFTGNDARALQKQNDDGSWSITDIYGDPNSDLDFSIAGINSAAQNFNLIRKKYIRKGNTDWPISAGTDSTNSEWELIPLNNFSGIGIHTVQAISAIRFTAFNIEGQISHSIIDTIRNTIHVKVKNFIDLSAIKCSYSSSNGTISNKDFTKTLNYTAPINIQLKSKNGNDSSDWILYVQKGVGPIVTNISYESNIITVQFERKIVCSKSQNGSVNKPYIKMLHANTKNVFPITIAIDSSESTLHIYHYQLVKSLEPFILTIDSVEDVEGNILNGYTWGFDAEINAVNNSFRSEESPQIYPNPAKKQFKVQLSVSKEIMLSLVTIDGKTYLSKKCMSNENIEVGNLPRGLYYVIIGIGIDNAQLIKPIVLN